jgi:hypothetical protein
MLWRAGLRISEALAVTETELDPDRGAVLVRVGKGGRRREIGMDRWASEHYIPGSSSVPSFPWDRCGACSTARPVEPHVRRH